MTFTVSRGNLFVDAGASNSNIMNMAQSSRSVWLLNNKIRLDHEQLNLIT